MTENVFSNASLTGATTVSGSINFSGAQISGMYKRHVGLGLCDNTSDMDKPISNAVKSALDNIIGNASVLATKPALDTLSELATTVSTLSANSGVVADNAVTAAKIADNAVTAGKIDAYAVTATKINTDAVTAEKIKNGAITTAKIADNAVTPAKLDRVYALDASLNAVSTSLNSYAPKASPTFTGTVTLPVPTDASSNQAATTSFVMNKLYDVSNNKFTIVPAAISQVIPTVGAMVFSTTDQKLYVCAQDASGVVSWFEVGATQVV
jgi:hypothetical protein